AWVLLQDARKTTIFEGKADIKGRCVFPAPAPGDYWLSVRAGLGHGWSQKITIKASEPVPDKEQSPSPQLGALGSSSETQVQFTPYSRSELTRFPWLSVALGLGLIAAVSAASLLVRRLLA